MAGYMGGMIFSLIIGQLATTIGYEPLFACLTVFDLTAFAIIALVLGQRGGKSAAAVPNATAGAD
jgi:ACS family hexuronate transporter-like MFS transporter